MVKWTKLLILFITTPLKRLARSLTKLLLQVSNSKRGATLFFIWRYLMNFGLNNSLGFVPLDGDQGAGVNNELNNDLELKVIAHRDQYYNYIINRYREMIINLRAYNNLPFSINAYKLEWYLRNGYDCVIGKNELGHHCFLGVVQGNYSNTSADQPYAYSRFSRSAIHWLVPDRLIPKKEHFLEITNDDNATTGDYVVLRNKPVTYTSDFAIIEYYAKHLCEIMGSRYSLILQSKYSKFLRMQPNNETMRQILQKIENGAPFILTTDLINPDRDIIDMANPHIHELLRSMKQEFNDQLGELNNQLGINSTGIDKQSGVSEEEVSSNNDLITSVGNMYINGVKQGLDLYNKRYGLDIQVVLNQKSQQVGLGIDESYE